MNKRVLVISILILMAILGGGVYLLTGDADKQAKDQMTESEPAQTTITTERTGQYLDYKDGIIASTKGTKLIFFHAAWCPQCRALEADIKDKGVPAGVAIIKTDYDTSQSLRQQYGVTLQTTVVRVDDEGELVKKFVAYDDPSLEAVVSNLL